jgi:hypothetical protein
MGKSIVTIAVPDYKFHLKLNFDPTNSEGQHLDLVGRIRERYGEENGEPTPSR